MHSPNILFPKTRIKLTNIAILICFLCIGCLKPKWNGQFSPIYHIPYEVKWDKIDPVDAGNWLDITYAEFLPYITLNMERQFERPRVYFEIPIIDPSDVEGKKPYGYYNKGFASGFSTPDNVIHIYNPWAVAHEFGHIVENQVTGDIKETHQWTPEIYVIIMRLQSWNIYRWQ